MSNKITLINRTESALQFWVNNNSQALTGLLSGIPASGTDSSNYILGPGAVSGLEFEAGQVYAVSAMPPSAFTVMTDTPDILDSANWLMTYNVAPGSTVTISSTVGVRLTDSEES